MTLLRLEQLTVDYGGLRALNALDLEVATGSLVGLIGPNGAGKTTCIDAITGFAPAQGRVLFNGRDLSGLRPHRRANLGVGRTWQSLELFDDLTVEENLWVGADRQSAWSIVADFVVPNRRRDRTAINEVLELLDLGDLAHRKPSELSHGQRKLVSTARALAAQPALVCMDEPAAGLDHDESVALGQRLRQIVGAGTSILLVDHDMDLVLSVCDFVYVIDFGCKIAEGTPAEIRVDQRVVAAYLGDEPTAPGATTDAHADAEADR